MKLEIDLRFKYAVQEGAAGREGGITSAILQSYTFALGDLIEPTYNGRFLTKKPGLIIAMQKIEIHESKTIFAGYDMPNDIWQSLAKQCGFDAAYDMVEHIQHKYGLPFIGRVATWEFKFD